MRRPSRSRPRNQRLSLFALLLIGGTLLLACRGDVTPGAVHVSKLDGDIGPVTADFVDRSLDRAEEHEATLWVLELDTPGGLISATDDIVQRIEAATVPVAVFVSPLGARAASAGTFITMSAHIAAMAPNTQIGAAHPVAGGGEEIEGSLGEKITNDAAADIRGIADLRGRNAEWAEQAVRESVSVTGAEAVDLNVVDLVAVDLADLLAQIDRREIELRPGGTRVTIHTAGAVIERTDMSFLENVLDFIADPNIAFLLISLGGLAIFIEIVSPGLIGPGVFGVIMMILAFFSVGALETEPAGIALVVLAFILLAVEVFFVPGFGFFGIGGIIALLVGGLILFSDAPTEPEFSIWVLVGVAAFVGAVFFGLWALILNERRKTGRDFTVEHRMLGKRGRTRSVLDPNGIALVDSEMWTARSAGGRIGELVEIEVIDVDGLCLVVEAVEQAVTPLTEALGDAPPRSS